MLQVLREKGSCSCCTDHAQNIAQAKNYEDTLIMVTTIRASRGLAWLKLSFCENCLKELSWNVANVLDILLAGEEETEQEKLADAAEQAIIEEELEQPSDEVGELKASPIGEALQSHAIVTMPQSSDESEAL